MSKSIKKITLSCLAALCCFCVFAGVLSAKGEKAFADRAKPTDVTTETFIMESGAEIRTEDPSGIRFGTWVNASYIADGYEFGTLIIPKHVYSGELTDLTAETAKVGIASSTGFTDSADGYSFYSVSLVDIPAKYYEMEIIARAYRRNTADNTYEYVSNPQTRSLVLTAAKALAAGATNDILTEIVDTAITSISLDKTSCEVEKGGASEKLAIDKNYPAIWSSSNTSVAIVDENGTVRAVGEGSATITAKLGSRTATCSVTVPHFDTLYIGASTSGDYEVTNVSGTVSSVTFGGRAIDDKSWVQEGTSLYIAKGAFYNYMDLEVIDNFKNSSNRASGRKQLVVTTDSETKTITLEVITETLSFEDGYVPSAITTNGIAFVADGSLASNYEGANNATPAGSKKLSVKFEKGMTPKITIAKAYVDLLFADAEVSLGLVSVELKSENVSSLDLTVGLSSVAFNNGIAQRRSFSKGSDLVITSTKPIDDAVEINIDKACGANGSWVFVAYGDNVNVKSERSNFDTLYIGATTSGDYEVTNVGGTVSSVTFGGKTLEESAWVQDGMSLYIAKGALYNCMDLDTNHTNVTGNIRMTGRKNLVIETNSGSKTIRLEVITETISFEDGYIPSAITLSGATMEVSADAVGKCNYSHTAGEYGLKITVPANSSKVALTVSKEYFDLVWAQDVVFRWGQSSFVSCYFETSYGNGGKAYIQLAKPSVDYSDIIFNLKGDILTSGGTVNLDLLHGRDSGWKVVAYGDNANTTVSYTVAEA